jgi:hypothetical protein
VAPGRFSGVARYCRKEGIDYLAGIQRDAKKSAIASVLMALDAAGVSIDEVVRDAKARQGAIDICQAEQRRLFEAQWARKSAETFRHRQSWRR